MSEPNAIERLREFVAIVDDISEMNGEQVRGGEDALAAVDALYQAATAADEEAATTGGFLTDRTRARLANALLDVRGEA